MLLGFDQSFWGLVGAFVEFIKFNEFNEFDNFNSENLDWNRISPHAKTFKVVMEKTYLNELILQIVIAGNVIVSL